MRFRIFLLHKNYGMIVLFKWLRRFSGLPRR
jgi:hypothetical protein